MAKTQPRQRRHVADQRVDLLGTHDRGGDDRRARAQGELHEAAAAVTTGSRRTSPASISARRVLLNAGGFAWITGEPVTYTNWAPGEPNNLNRNLEYAGRVADYLEFGELLTRDEFAQALARWAEVERTKIDEKMKELGIGLAAAILIDACGFWPGNVSASGLTLGEPLTGFQGILRGVPELIAAERTMEFEPAK